MRKIFLFLGLLGPACAHISAMRTVQYAADDLDSPVAEQMPNTNYEENRNRLDERFINAIRNRHNIYASFLIGIGHVDVNATDNYGRPPLMYAAAHNSPLVLEVLRWAGADVNSFDVHGASALMYAASNNAYEAAEWIIRHTEPAKLLSYIFANDNDRHFTALHWAAEYACSGVITLLIKTVRGLEASIDAEEVTSVFINSGKTPPLHMALKNGYEEVAKILISEGADLNQKIGPFQETALYVPITSRSKFALEIMEIMINAGADISVKDIEDKTLLHFAALYGRFDIVKLLMKNTARNRKSEYICAQDIHGYTAFHFAVAYSRFYTANLILQELESTDEKIRYMCTQNCDGLNALHIAVDRSNFAGIEFFLHAVRKLCNENNKRIVETEDENFADTLGIYAARVIKFALSAKDNNGQTPFYMALQNEETAIAVFLFMLNSEVNRILGDELSEESDCSE